MRRWRIDRLVQRRDPAVYFLVSHRGYHQQIAGAGGGDVGDSKTLGPLPALFLIAMIKELPRRASEKSHRAAAFGGIDVPIGLSGREFRGHVGENDH